MNKKGGFEFSWSTILTLVLGIALLLITIIIIYTLKTGNDSLVRGLFDKIRFW